MNAIASVVSPTLLAVFALLSFAIGAILFLVSRRGGSSIDLRVPLSWAEPAELRVVLYLILGACSSAVALVLRLLLPLATEGLFLAWLLLILAVVGLLGTLAFFYAAMGSLLQAAFGTRGRPPFWFSRFLSPLDGTIMNVGDFLSGLLFHAAPSRERLVRRRHAFDDEYEELMYDDAPPRRPRVRSRPVSDPPGPARRRAVVDEYDDFDEAAFDDARTSRRPMRPSAGTTGRVRPRAEVDEYEDWDEPVSGLGAPIRRPSRPSPIPRRPTAEMREAEDELDYVIMDEHPSRRMRRVPSRERRDRAWEKIELALQEYEAELSPSQVEKLRAMRHIVESLKQAT